MCSGEVEFPWVGDCLVVPLVWRRHRDIDSNIKAGRHPGLTSVFYPFVQQQQQQQHRSNHKHIPTSLLSNQKPRCVSLPPSLPLSSPLLPQRRHPRLPPWTPTFSSPRALYKVSQASSKLQPRSCLFPVLDPDLPFMLASEKLKAQGCRDEKTFLECLLNGCPPIIPPGGCISEITCYIIWCT